MEDSADIGLYEEIVGNPAYSSSSDTGKSDPVSFQFKEPRQTECREEDFFARARSRPDPTIISHALAGKNSQDPRSCDTFVECGSSRREFYDSSTILAPTSNTSTFDTFATVAPDVEPTLRTSVYDTFAIHIRLSAMHGTVSTTFAEIIIYLGQYIKCSFLENFHECSGGSN